MEDVIISRLTYDKPRPVGRITQRGEAFTYDKDYLTDPAALPLSLSLPLADRSYTSRELRPYFEGLLPEGMTRQELAARLQLPEDAWLDILAACGRDCIGDIMVTRSRESPALDRVAYEPVSLSDIAQMLDSPASTSRENATRRLSLTGTQNKTGMAHDPSLPITEGWFRPQGLAATTHILKTSSIRDIPENEFLCMQAARACGIDTASVALIDAAKPVLAIERFDRIVTRGPEGLHVERLHQEDLAQALGCTSGSKYAELEGGSIAAVGGLLRTYGSQPARDLNHFAQMICFSYLIGNCDAHLKNYALLHRPGAVRARTRLAAAYDLVCTTCYPKYSRELAMDYGGIRAIDDITPETFRLVAHDLGITAGALKRIARPIAEQALVALERAGAGAGGPVLPSTAYIADDLIEDMQPRQAVLAEFCRS